MSARNDTFGVLALVSITRLTLLATALVFAAPVSFIRGNLPTNTVKSQRFTAFKTLISQETIGRLPDWVERNGKYTFMLKTTHGMNHLDALVEKTPTRLLRLWQHFGILTMTIFVTTWAFILLAATAFWFWHTGTTAIETTHWALNYDWLSLLQLQEPTDHSLLERLTTALASIPDAYHTIFNTTIMAATVIAVWWLIMLPLIPGLILHELGHYAAIREAGGTVESYGILLIGPVLGGAFVQPGNDVNLLDKHNQFFVWSAGIANSLIWGTLLTTTALLLGGHTSILKIFTEGAAPTAVQSVPLASVLLLIGVTEIMNGFLNAIPLGPVDGGGFIRTQEADWWGFNDAIDNGDPQ